MSSAQRWWANCIVRLRAPFSAIDAKRTNKLSAVMLQRVFKAIRVMNQQLARCRKAARLILVREPLARVLDCANADMQLNAG